MHRTHIRNLLIAACLIAWVITAINPLDPEAWALEQIAGILCISCFIWSLRSVQFSISCWIGLAILFIFHSIGTHYTYSLTPYDEMLRAMTGTSLNEILGWERNNYDRFVHWLFGLTTARVFYEFLLPRTNTHRPMAWFLSFNLVVSASALYELMEWAAALVFANDAGILYLGTQGDVWDAQIDIFLAGVGALISLLGYEAVHLAEKLKLKHQHSQLEC